jgi:UDP-N-acetylglucosamine--N-acetylmuramyl-(pentapeptide) pyrophosphoryl-undecaprenol N-acetylglucosamine transferase
MERFFPADKILLTGNPVRQSLLETRITREDALRSLGLDPQKKTIMLVGGSLGARTINQSVLQHLEDIRQSNVQFYWQTGKYYSEQIAEELRKKGRPENLVVTDFITDMGAAYKASDLVISRSGAGSISEFCLLGKPVILVPSPNVAEDHQTKNAMALVNKGAAVMVRDADCDAQGLTEVKNLFETPERHQAMSAAIAKMAVHGAADKIVDEIEKLMAK